MDELFTLHPNGLFLRSEAMDHGYNDRVLADARHSGVIARVRHGAYAPHDTWVNGDDIERHRLRSQAVLLTHGDRVALSHTSGAIEHGLRLWRPDLERVHVTRLDKGSGRQHGDVVYHEDTWTAADIYAKDELLVMGPETCALGAASLTTVECGIPILDSLFDLDLGSEESLVTAYKKRSHWPHSQRLQLTVRFARPGAQSIGESLARNVMRVQHLPEPELQFKVYDDHGNLIGITDFAWPDLRLLGEFDGKIKYGRLLKEGEEPGDAVFREKEREDLLREITGFMMIRYIWANLFDPRTMAARTRRKMRMAAAA